MATGKDFIKVSPAVLDSVGRLTLPQVLAAQAQRMDPSRVAIREKAYGIWKTYNWQTYLNYVRQTALGLVSLGLRRGENIGIVTNNHPEWLFSELGGQAVGAVTVNLFTSSVPEELATALGRFRATVVIVQDQEQVDKLLEMKDRLGHVRKVIYIDPTGMRRYADNPWLISFSELLDRGRSLDLDEPERFSREMARGKAGDVALMIQTSGTTGIPKLAMLSHRSFTEMARQWLETAPIGIESNWISITPPAWIVDQMWGVGVTLAGGMTMNFPETLETVTEDFREIGPSVIITSSRFWEDLASKIRVKMDDAGWVKKKIFKVSERIGMKTVDLESRKEPVPVHLRFFNAVASRLAFRPLLDRVGCSQMVSAYTGGHPISPQVIRFFRAIGLNLKQCYGLTESGGIFQVQPDGEFKLETVGKPLPRTAVRLSPDQEVLVKSDSVFVGYYDDYQATETAFSDGWLKTGDAGYLDEDGHLLIIGRKEDIIRNKQGSAFSPDFIETRLKFSPYIKEAVVFGEGRPYITALVNIDMGNVGNWAEDRMIPYTTYTDLTQQPEVEKLIHGEVREVNGQLPDPMKIRKFILLYKLLDADDEELTRTGKVRRRFVYGLYIRLIEAMYENKDSLEVRGKVRYRDGQVGTLETRVRVITT
ncbi:MAG TPA: AMP-binding protein [Syntrophales bacterium]|nr:AMP-binding protein [Syntrophales bacterium]HOX93759.1 AMP-binding protein [Syntrophales bacterium]HPI55900.1 AMP-binding protein [Syntrophales bacterium]HPN23609.1 AMP-binding protein [Syntrophales bacterium]HQM27866.1 AMP-binding protein [Syntrophales bacterium]